MKYFKGLISFMIYTKREPMNYGIKPEVLNISKQLYIRHIKLKFRWILYSN